MEVQYVYHCCLCLVFDQTTTAQDQKYLLLDVINTCINTLEDHETAAPALHLNSVVRVRL